MQIQEQYFKKSALSILFGRLAKNKPEHKDDLINIWRQIKVVGTECADKCETCGQRIQCAIACEAANLFQKYHKTRQDDGYWNDVVRASTHIFKKYGEHRFARKILADVLEELSECEKERQAKQKGE